MIQPGFIPALPQSDIARAAQLIQGAYSPVSVHVSSDRQRRLQQELFDIQKRYESWGLVIPFLNHKDSNVQFFGAHTVQVKIARDWDTLPQESAPELRELLLELTSHSIASGKNKVILRKLFVAITSLALRIAPGSPSRWPDWIVSTVEFLSSHGTSPRHLLDFLSIVAEEVDTAELVGQTKMRMQQTLLDASPLVMRAVTETISQFQSEPRFREVDSALKCLQSWMPVLRADDITPLIPLLISLLNPRAPNEQLDSDIFTLASDTLQEIMSRSPLASGAGTATLTEPLMVWLSVWGTRMLESNPPFEVSPEVSHSICKLITTLGDHSNMYLASNILSQKPVRDSSHMRSHLIQGLLHLLLGFTGLPGYYGADEEESEITLGFWYLFQESLWNVDFDGEDEGEDGDSLASSEVETQNRMAVVHAVYVELVKVLRRKVAWPSQGVLASWTKDQVDKFQVYRRDVGDTLINAYYILRNDMLGYYLTDIQQRLSRPCPHEEGWEEIEATLHCIMSIQEAVPLEDNSLLSQLFGLDIFRALPTAGQDRVRRTMLGLIGTYASWFTTQSKGTSPTSTPSLLMNAISYVVAALPEPALCLPAANALRDVCDANRAALASHIEAFAELHAGLLDIPDTERSKVLQSIASVIQALPPEEEIPPILAIVSPVVEKLKQALHSSSQLPEEARLMAIVQLQTLTGVSKGLTRTTDSLLVLEESPANCAEVQRLKKGRDDYRMVKLREELFSAVRNTIEIWSTDASVADALGDFIRSITSLPSDTTLLSLPAGPLLQLICIACQRHLTAVWLSLAKSLVIQLDPPTQFLTSTIKPSPNAEALTILSDALPVVLQTSLSMLAPPNALESNPDIVQAFFGCLDSVAKHFVNLFYNLPSGALDALMQCAVGSLALQERYSLVATCTFLETLVRRTFSSDELGDASAVLVREYGRPILRAILWGFAGVAPRSATVNLIELLSTIVSKYPAETRAWMNEILFANDFVESRATPEAKRAFIKAVVGSRSPKRTREAAQEFTLIARGLEGTSFGYASISM